MSRISRIMSCYHFPLVDLIQAFVEEHSEERPIDSVVVKSAMYGKKLKLPHHEFVLFELGNTERPNLRNHVVLDRNRLDGASILSSIQHSNSAIARDEFRFSCDGNRDRLLRKCDLTPYEAIETIEFPTSDLLPFYELATIALVTSRQRDHYHLLDANCYWFAGLVWEQVLQMYPEARHEILRDGVRGKFAGLLNYFTSDKYEQGEIGVEIQTMISQMKLMIARVQRVWNTPDSTDRNYVPKLSWTKGHPQAASRDYSTEGALESNKLPRSIPEQRTPQHTHALHELLFSEYAYASDLVLIRGIFLPLAQGKQIRFPLPPGINRHMLSMHKDPPMSAQDVEVVFGNIKEISLLADELSDRLGSIILGGIGDYQVGKLFCELAPRMTPMYLAYITRHPAAVARYNQLSANPTPAMAHLLIKPLQRLLKYPLILQTILKHTPISLGHDRDRDRATLALAKDKTEQIVRQVNEGKRQWEVKGMLESGKSPHDQPRLIQDIDYVDLAVRPAYFPGPIKSTGLSNVPQKPTYPLLFAGLTYYDNDHSSTESSAEPTSSTEYGHYLPYATNQYTRIYGRADGKQAYVGWRQ
ncbi:Rho guanine nucleotide exchange factor 6 [Rhizoctonia solani]|uniref:Rho guanine nucleotide exchange factor 6 n=1 Tax=Rhizoctonia solani TaxID=456999 RepID=A0A0K6FNG1_9AGAM|nr:Rho guanine nucleotide exchange factor 6 [Rhizoctonia solani]